MGEDHPTCWSVIAGAAAGDRVARDRFARRYEPVVRAYLAARWRSSPCRADLEDAVQDVFVAFFKPGGALAKERDQLPGGFRPFLYGVVRNVALQTETRRGRDRLRGGDAGLTERPDDEETASRLFDRTWALALVREAADRLADQARRGGPAELLRVELLRLRFHEGLPIRDIAARWETDPAKLHHEYAKAREEFRAVLGEVVAFHNPGTPTEIDRACAALATLLGE